MNTLKTNTILVAARVHGVNDKIATLILGMLFGVEQVEVGPVVASILINIVAPKLEEEETKFDAIDEYHYGITEVISGCAVGLKLGVLQHHHVKKIINDCWKHPYVGYGLIQYLNETKILDEIGGSELDAILDEIVVGNTKVCAEIRAGKDKAIGALVGQVMKRCKADPAVVKELLFSKIRGAGQLTG